MSAQNERLPWHKLNRKKQNLIIIGFAVCIALIIIGVTSVIF